MPAKHRTGGIVTCTLLLIVTLLLAVMAGLLYEMKNRPAWLSYRELTWRDMQTVKVQMPMKGKSVGEAVEQARSKALDGLRTLLRKKATKQIAIAYAWESLDEATKLTTVKALKEALDGTSLDALEEIGQYTDWVGGTVFVLYGIDNAEIDAMLQRIYEDVNKKILEAMTFDDEEIEETNTTKEPSDENQTL